jgi:hypothetical protein
MDLKTLEIVWKKIHQFNNSHWELVNDEHLKDLLAIIESESSDCQNFTNLQKGMIQILNASMGLDEESRTSICSKLDGLCYSFINLYKTQE